MRSCSKEVSTEEYAAHFDADLHPDYPKILKWANKSYVLKVKEFKYAAKGSSEERHFLRVEIWDAPQDRIEMMILLVKSEHCRFHSPMNPNFDIKPELLGSSEGAYLLKAMLETLARFDFSFLVEEIYPDDVGYDQSKKRYNAKKYAKLKSFYNKLGFSFEFDKDTGKGYVMLKKDNLAQSEEECLRNTISSILSKKI